MLRLVRPPGAAILHAGDFRFWMMQIYPLLIRTLLHRPSCSILNERLSVRTPSGFVLFEIGHLPLHEFVEQGYGERRFAVALTPDHTFVD